MIEVQDRSSVVPWVVCESGRRWQTAVSRFAPSLMPAPLAARVLPGSCDSLAAALGGQSHAVVLWEVERTNVATTCDCLTRTSARWPHLLQLIAATGLTDGERLALSELGAAFALEYPEQLPRLAGMIKAYFATSSHHLD